MIVVVVIVIVLVIVVMALVVPVVMARVMAVVALLPLREVTVRRNHMGVGQVLLPFGVVAASKVVGGVLALLPLGEISSVFGIRRRVVFLARAEAPLRVVVVPH